MKNYRNPLLEKPWFVILSLACLVAAGLLIASFMRAGDNLLLCSLPNTKSQIVSDYSPTTIQLQAILHYATSKVVPQQSLGEIRASFDVLKKVAPCNFLVFGLGHDSFMWASFNPGGNTLFLEEDPKWVQTVLKNAPQLRAHTVNYQTQLREADHLLKTYRSEPQCSPSTAVLRGNTGCRLALNNLPDEVYDREWELIMIDAPRGYFAEAPGRMSAIYSAAVMARNRKGPGVTHVYLHDVDRKVEKAYAEEFLCRKYLVKAVGRLWHFEIPSAVNVNVSQAGQSGATFC
ncbi:hypothetical protein FNV43_RR25770 [Rhamnella rubrinervis]|uniref:Polysaccharide biosynthesis domain-containing protein n=1 Tax=Rhamnella rubrinervis TaxID=2594499 RepID=A0A8K0DNJ0_9ROSA|nr:hypothetical protein FNV43_RR25770 [Rhamnella rubrinervis]